MDVFVRYMFWQFVDNDWFIGIKGSVFVDDREFKNWWEINCF